MLLQILATAVYHAIAASAMVVKNRELVTALKIAPVNLDKLRLLKEANETWTYDFTQDENYTFIPGSVNMASLWTSPTMVGTGMTMQIVSLGPCGILPPHQHPRADNVAVATHGTTKVWMHNENGAEMIETTLTPGVMTVFPKGSVHSMMNIGCSNAQLVSVLNHEDPGTLNILNSATTFPDHIIKAAFQGELTDQAWKKLKEKIQPVGTNAQFGIEECYGACGIRPRGRQETFTFNGAAPIWDGNNGKKEVYFDVKTGKTKAGTGAEGGNTQGHQSSRRP